MGIHFPEGHRTRSAQPAGKGVPSEPAEVVVVCACRLDDAAEAIRQVRTGRTVVLDASGQPAPLQRRLVDFACGGIAAMEGQVRRLGRGVVLLAPLLARIERIEEPDGGQPQSPSASSIASARA
jgi:FtsZ-interacting cell division protein YlmF